MVEKAPIAFFAYNRPEHALAALKSLADNTDSQSSDLFIFCDGAKSGSDKESVDKVRDVVRSQQWCGSVQVIESEVNLGLAESIITGVTRLCTEFGKVIVLEDDLILSPDFLEYMNNSLHIYQNSSRVMQVSGYMYPIKNDHLDETSLMPFISSWGWATWDRAWRQFDPEVKQYKKLSLDTEKIIKFNLDGSYPYFAMLKEQLEGKIDSWAIRWYFSIFMMDGLALYPAHSLVSNIGFDGSGTHCSKNEQSLGGVYKRPVSVAAIDVIAVDDVVFDRVKKYLSSGSQPIDGFIRNSIRNIMKKITTILR